MNGGFVARPLPHCPVYNHEEGTYCHLPDGHEGERDHEFVPVEKPDA